MALLAAIQLTSCALWPGRAAPAGPNEARIARDTREATTKHEERVENQVIQRLSGRPRARREDAAEPFEIRFELMTAGDVVLRIDDEAGTEVFRQDLGPRDAGIVRASWPFATQSGNPVAPGVYTFSIDWTGEGGAQETYPAGANTAGEELYPKGLHYDSSEKSLSYVLPKAGRVRVRAQMENLPLLVTLLDWRPQPAGRQTIPWAGTDASGLLQVGSHPKLQARIDAYALPINSIIVDPVTDSFPPRPDGAADVMPPNAYRHALHQPQHCGEPDFEVSLPGIDSGPESAPPVLSGEQTVRIVLDDARAAYLLNGGYELMFFVDLVFLFEEEEGVNPFNFTLDTSDLSPGLHFLTVNLLTYDDHAGVVTLPFRVE